MDKTKLNVPLEPLKELCEQYHVSELALFGSAVRGDCSDTSDLDILVDFMPDARIGFIELSRMQRELSAIFNRPVDLVPKQGLKPIIRDAVISSAEILYAA